MQEYHDVTRTASLPNDGAQSGPPSGGVMKFVSQALGLVVIAIIAILVGMLMLVAFAPTPTIHDSFAAMGFRLACPSDPSSGELPAVQTGDGSVIPADDVPTGENTANKPKGGKGTKNQETYLIVTIENIQVTSYRPADNTLNLGDVLTLLDGMRMAMGSDSFLPPCAPSPADPDEGGEIGDEAAGGAETGGTTGGTTGGQPEPVSPANEEPTAPDNGLCANNDGIEWQGDTCVCPGLVDKVTLCKDGTKIDQVTDQSCNPEQSCSQPTDPTDPQNPPSDCPCNYVCVEEKPNSNECTTYGYRDCTGAVCTGDVIP